MKKIKQLCYTQLDTITTEDLQRIITQDTPIEPKSNHTHQTLKINDISDDEMADELESTSSNVGVASEDLIQVNVESEELLMYNSEGLSRKEDYYGESDEKLVTTNETHYTKLNDTKVNINNDQKEKESITEDALLVEMKLRERLLEAQVRRLTEREEQRIKKERVKNDNNSSDESDGESGELMEPGEVTDEPGEVTGEPGEVTEEPGELMEPGEVTEEPGEVTEEPGEVTEGPGEVTEGPGEVTEEPGELMELDLRQRALESLLAKRREKLLSK